MRNILLLILLFPLQAWAENPAENGFGRNPSLAEPCTVYDRKLA